MTTVTTTASSTSIVVGQTSTITATIKDQNNANMPDGTSVTFAISDSTLGAITPATTSTSSGTATATFTASKTKVGTVTVTATAGGKSGTVDVTITGVTSVTLSAQPATLVVGATSSISATILDKNSANMPDGTAVKFALSESTLGTISATDATTSNGKATATFTAALTKVGVETITATAGDISKSVDITINAVEAGSITFTSATPASIGIKSSGKPEDSTVTFLVKDANGNPVLDGTVTVDYCLAGPSGGRLPSAGGEYLGNTYNSAIETYTDANGNGCYDYGETYTDANGNAVYDSPMYAAGASSTGVATVILHSGKVAGNATIMATVRGKGLASSTPVISIGGGIPNASHFTMASEFLNIRGLDFNGEETSITVWMADRFGNANVLEGTTVSFYAEAGATATSSVTLDAEGKATVKWREQNPLPATVALDTGSNFLDRGETEAALLARVKNEYGIDTTLHPRIGVATIVASVMGEEAFSDQNGNGIFDSGEPFSDTYQEPYIDANDSGTREDGTGVDPFEIYIDKNKNGSWDGANGTWDSSKALFDAQHILVTGPPAYIMLSKYNTGNGTFEPFTTFNIANGGSALFKLIVSDVNLNRLTPDTTIAISADKGKVSPDGVSSIKMINEFHPGPEEINFILSDSDSSTIKAEISNISIKVTWEGADYVAAFSGTVN
ncbi:MAG: hypothetical protein HZA20_12805 [Nitrospirae bacterium]|nr:hypothetical protein [Nitrospirota bacterium]